MKITTIKTKATKHAWTHARMHAHMHAHMFPSLFIWKCYPTYKLCKCCIWV